MTCISYAGYLKHMDPYIRRQETRNKKQETKTEYLQPSYHNIHSQLNLARDTGGVHETSFHRRNTIRITKVRKDN